MSDVLILIPAAGASSRMRGRDKLLEKIQGQTQLTRVVAAALATGARVVVCLPGITGERAEVLAPLACERLQLIPVPDPREGMAASLRCGAEWVLRGVVPDGIMILPADMPELETKDFQEVMKRFSGTPQHPVRGCADDGKPGHPVILPARTLKSLTRLRGDQGAKTLLEAEAVTRVPLKGQRALIDLDSPEDWADWRAHRGL